MKRTFTIACVCMLMLVFANIFAQCDINTSNTTTGFSPPSLSCITQNSVYGQTVQIYVPAGISGVTVDSLKITGITGLPTGISYSLNPDAGAIVGGGWGCIWFSGTTTDTVGNYTLTFSGNAYTSYGTLSLSSPPISTLFSYVLSVCPTLISVCDTLINVVSPLDTPEIYVFGGTDTGYWSGNNSYGDVAKAEGFTAPIGAHVNGGFLSFGYVSINSNDSANNVKVYLWNGDGPAGSPGTVLDSASIPLGEIAAEVTASYIEGAPLPIYVSFSSSVALTDTTFYIGVVLPTTTGDTVALFTSSVNGGDDGNGWEEILTNSGTNWDSYYTDYGYQFGNFIAADFCVSGYIPQAAFSAVPQATCINDTVHFTDLSANSPTSRVWTFDGGNPPISISQNPVVTYSAAGTYSVKLITANLFGADTITQTNYITIYPNPNDTVVSVTPASSSSTANGSITVNGILGVSPYTYMWSNHDTGATLSNVLPAVYALTITDGYGCKYVQDSVIVPYTTGINQVSALGQIKIYPNPASEQLNIEWSTLPNAEVAIIDMNGKSVMQFIANGSLLNTFDIHNLSSGAYVIRITDRTTNQQQSVVFSKL